MIGFGLGAGDLFFGKLDELFEDEFDGANVCVLADVLVLVKRIFRKFALLLLDGLLDADIRSVEV